MTTAQILARLERSLDLIGGGPSDVPERQRTLRATMEWSYDLLEGREKTLFRRLGVFAGSFDLEAAEAGGGGDLETLASLVDKSLLRLSDEGRFAMLHVVREFCRDRLDAAGETDAASRAHAAHYLELVRQVEPDLRTARHLARVNRLDAD